jgi:hypothetical protein
MADDKRDPLGFVDAQHRPALEAAVGQIAGALRVDDILAATRAEMQEERIRQHAVLLGATLQTILAIAHTCPCLVAGEPPCGATAQLLDFVNDVGNRLLGSAVVLARWNALHPEQAPLGANPALYTALDALGKKAGN